MTRLKNLIFAALMVILMVVMAIGCITVNKVYVLPAKKDTVSIPCHQMHLPYMPLPSTPWRNDERAPFYPFYRHPGIIDDTTKLFRADWLKSNDTLKIKYDSIFYPKSGIPVDSIRVRRS